MYIVFLVKPTKVTTKAIYQRIYELWSACVITRCITV